MTGINNEVATLRRGDILWDDDDRGAKVHLQIDGLVRLQSKLKTSTGVTPDTLQRLAGHVQECFDGLELTFWRLEELICGLNVAPMIYDFHGKQSNGQSHVGSIIQRLALEIKGKEWSPRAEGRRIVSILDMSNLGIDRVLSGLVENTEAAKRH
jgi:hypothetical protein